MAARLGEDSNCRGVGLWADAAGGPCDRVSSRTIRAAVAESVDAHGSGPCGVYKSPWRFKSSQPHEAPHLRGFSLDPPLSVVDGDRLAPGGRIVPLKIADDRGVVGV